MSNSFLLDFVLETPSIFFPSKIVTPEGKMEYKIGTNQGIFLILYEKLP
jgi:hypothetical protein